MVKKKCFNKDRLFFSCPNDKENSCRLFEWAPDEPSHRSYDTVNFSKEPLEKQSCNEAMSYIETEFMRDFTSKSKL